MNTFTMAFTSSTVTLPIPDVKQEKEGVTKSIKVFNFWSGDLSVVDTGLNTQQLTIVGTDNYKRHIPDSGGGIMFPITFPIYFNYAGESPMVEMLEKINTAMNGGEEVTIAGLDDVHDGTFIIVSFSWDVIKGINHAFKYRFTLRRS